MSFPLFLFHIFVCYDLPCCTCALDLSMCTWLWRDDLLLLLYYQVLAKPTLHWCVQEESSTVDTSADAKVAGPAVCLPQDRPPALHLQHVFSPCCALSGQHLRGVRGRCGRVGDVWTGLAPLL